MRAKQKIDLSAAWVTWTIIGHGIQIYALFQTQYPCPLGLVWGIGRGGSSKNKNGMFEVFGSFTAYFARRNGVRKRINDEILKQYCAVVTGVSHTSGLAFMKATGYLYDSRIDSWIKVAPKPKPKPRDGH